MRHKKTPANHAVNRVASDFAGSLIVLLMTQIMTQKSPVKLKLSNVVIKNKLGNVLILASLAYTTDNQSPRLILRIFPQISET